MDTEASPNDAASPSDVASPGSVTSPGDAISPGAVASPGDEAKQVGDEPKTETQTPSKRRPPHILAPDVLLCLREICRKWDVKNLHEFFTIPQGDPYFHDYLPARVRPTSLTRDGLQKLRYISEHCDRDEARLRIASTSMNQPEKFQGLVRPRVLDWVIASLVSPCPSQMFHLVSSSLRFPFPFPLFFLSSFTRPSLVFLFFT